MADTKFKPGHEKKGGRKPGGQNKITVKTKQVISAAIAANEERLLEELANLRGKDFIDGIAKLLPYVIPRLAAADINATLTKERTPEEIVKEIAEILDGSELQGEISESE